MKNQHKQSNVGIINMRPNIGLQKYVSFINNFKLFCKNTNIYLDKQEKNG